MKAHCFKGSYAHELQVGPVVVQRFFKRRPALKGRRWHAWIDRMWRS